MNHDLFATLHSYQLASRTTQVKQLKITSELNQGSVGLAYFGAQTVQH